MRSALDVDDQVSCYAFFVWGVCLCLNSIAHKKERESIQLLRVIQRWSLSREMDRAKLSLEEQQLTRE